LRLFIKPHEITFNSWLEIFKLKNSIKMSSEIIQLTALFFLIAAIYASAGFGGGSSYLAALSLFALSMTAMRSTSLMCNIIVVTGGTYIFWQNGYFNFKKILPLVLASVPMAFIGGMTPIKERTFFLLLGSCLVVAAVLMLLQNVILNREGTPQYKSGFEGKNEPLDAEFKDKNALTNTGFNPIKNALIGGLIGLLSGVVGIGGGIFLSPILNLSRWDTPKNVAATASFFILVNSISGLAGQFWQHKFAVDWSLSLPLLLAVFIGGQIGSRFSALKINALRVRQVTAILVFYAGANILWNNF
jgi:uncharacterized protein